MTATVLPLEMSPQGGEQRPARLGQQSPDPRITCAELAKCARPDKWEGLGLCFGHGGEGTLTLHGFDAPVATGQHLVTCVARRRVHSDPPALRRSSVSGTANGASDGQAKTPPRHMEVRPDVQRKRRAERNRKKNHPAPKSARLASCQGLEACRGACDGESSTNFILRDISCTVRCGFA